MKRILVTPIFLILIILLLISGITAINGLFINSSGANSPGGAIALIFSLIVLAILFIEQYVAKKVKQSLKQIWITELLLIVIVVVIVPLVTYLRNIQ